MIDDRRMKEQESAEAISGLKNCHGNAKLTIKPDFGRSDTTPL